MSRHDGNDGSWKARIFLLLILAGVVTWAIENQGKVGRDVKQIVKDQGTAEKIKAKPGLPKGQPVKPGREEAGIYTCAQARAAGDPPGIISIQGDPRGAQRRTRSGKICWD